MNAKLALAFLLALAPAAALAQPATAPIPGVDREAWLVPFPTRPADTFVRKGVQTGSLVSRSECERAGQIERGRFVFVEAMGRGACIRYYLSAEFLPRQDGRGLPAGRQGRLPYRVARRPLRDAAGGIAAARG